MLTTFQTKSSKLLGLIAILVFAGIAIAGAPAPSSAQGTPVADMPAVALPSAEEAVAALTAADGMLRFDVAEDATRFVWADAPVHDDGMPAYGTSFITQGYIYPEGTLSDGNGVLPDGSPEFPDLVLGEWTCRGWFVGDGMYTETGAIVITTQLYRFGEGGGDATLVSEGYELADVDVAMTRAITGGTGPYAQAQGEATQTLLGLNQSEGVNLTFEIAAQ